MQKLLIKVLEMMGVTDGNFTVEGIDNYLWRIELPLGKIDGGTYKGKHWGDAVIEDTDASLYFYVGNLYDSNRFSFGEGIVGLNYAKGNTGLAYTGELEDVVTARIKDLYNLNADGSEQGMQGDDYLSLDIWMDGLTDDECEFTGEQMDADFDDEESEAVLQTFSPYATA
jgi:hypothetical protein